MADVRTERLTLRPASVEDADALFAVTSDPRTWTYTPELRHGDVATTRRWLERAAELWARDGLSYWVVREDRTGQVIGVGGVQRQRTGNWNLYYRFSPEVWGNGYATELGWAALAAAHACDDSVPVLAWMRKVNRPSRRVAERLGLREIGEALDPSDGQRRQAFADRPVDLTT